MLPIAVAYWFNRFRGRRSAQVGLILLLMPVIALNIWGYAKTDHDAYLSTPGHYSGPLGPVVARCRELGIEQVACPYWIAYRLSFEAEEAPRTIVVDPDNYWSYGGNRYRPYVDAWPKSARRAWLCPDEDLEILDTALRSFSIRARAEHIGKLWLFIQEP